MLFGPVRDFILFSFLKIWIVGSKHLIEWSSLPLYSQIKKKKDE